MMLKRLRYALFIFPAVITAAHGADDVRLTFLEENCIACHDADVQKGGMRFDNLSELQGPDAIRRWTAAFDQVRSGEMPPKNKKRPAQADSDAFLQNVASHILASEAATRTAEGSGVLRRLNRAEYENTVHDLLGITTPLQEFLPQDPSLAGFDNVGEAMHSSAILLERYLDAADAALDAATANRKQAATELKTHQFTPEGVPKYLTRWGVQREGKMVFLGSDPTRHRFRLPSFSAPADGMYRVKIRTSASASQGQTVQYSLECSNVLEGGRRTLGYFDAPANEIGVTEFKVGMRFRAQLWIVAYPFSLHRIEVPEGAEQPGVAVHDVEIEGPLHDQWPPAAHQKLYGNHPLIPLHKAHPPSIQVLGHYPASQVMTPVPVEPEKELERIIREFLPYAFRRPVTDEEAQIYVSFAQQKMQQGSTFEEAVRVGLKTILCSPSFLFLRELPGQLDDFALASRLSYFLWSRMPDRELLSLAHKRQLSQPEVIRAQVERLLKDPKAKQFTENFTGQWLGLRHIDETSPDQHLYPEFDEWLQMSMVAESHRFFDELLQNDLSVTNFIDSDFTMLNERLAVHYGIDGVKGLELRRVKLPENSPRGGVLTQAAVLKVTANGTNTSPIERGAWVMENIVGRPIPPPPESIPAIEPDIRGATTIREQLAKHRSIESCASCHNKMDPPGLALENFDVIGGWREEYRIIEPRRTAKVVVNGSKVRYNYGLGVDASGVLLDGSQFTDIRGFKQRLLADRDSIARVMTKKLLVYATGRPMGFSDRKTVEDIVAATRNKDHGLRSIIHQIVLSPTFQQK